jgi:hypothetical protein
MSRLLIILIVMVCSSCVQQAHKRKVTFLLDVSQAKNIETVGVRGEGNPLSWEADYPMQEVVKDSLYKAEIVGETAYKWIDVKFTVNGKFELENKPNREVVFTGNETTYKAVFNVN